MIEKIRKEIASHETDIAALRAVENLLIERDKLKSEVAAAEQQLAALAGRKTTAEQLAIAAEKAAKKLRAEISRIEAEGIDSEMRRLRLACECIACLCRPGETLSQADQLLRRSGWRSNGFGEWSLDGGGAHSMDSAVRQEAARRLGNGNFASPISAELAAIA